jgi:hypothetical protein
MPESPAQKPAARTRSLAPPVFCWGLSAEQLAQVHAAAVTVEPTTSAATLGDRLLAYTASIVMYALPREGEDHSPLWHTITTARESHRLVAVIAVAVPNASYGAVLDGAKHGLTTLITARPRFDPADLKKALREAEQVQAPALVARAVRAALPSPLPAEAETLLTRALMLSHAPIDLPTLAHSCRMHERSLRKHCARHALPEPQRVIGWARLLHVAFLLDEGHSLAWVSEWLAFPSPDALRKLARRLLGHSLSHFTPPLLPAFCTLLAHEWYGTSRPARSARVIWTREGQRA